MLSALDGFAVVWFEEYKPNKRSDTRWQIVSTSLAGSAAARRRLAVESGCWVETRFALCVAMQGGALDSAWLAAGRIVRPADAFYGVLDGVCSARAPANTVPTLKACSAALGGVCCFQGQPALRAPMTAGRGYADIDSSCGQGGSVTPAGVTEAVVNEAVGKKCRSLTRMASSLFVSVRHVAAPLWGAVFR